MASEVSSALGTERNFSAAPKGTYEQRLASLPAHVGVAADTSNDAFLLARALGVLGDTLANFGTAQEQAKEKLGVAKAEELIKGLSEEDLKKYRAVDLLNTHGQFQLADNPYAVMTIEKWRGKYFGSKAQAEYAQLVADQGYEKTPEAEATRYDKFVKEKFAEYSKETSHLEAFTSGYFDNHIPNMLQQAKAQIADYSKNLKAVRDGTIQAEAGKIAQDSLNLTPEELKTRVQEFIRGAGVTKLTPAERIVLGKNLLNEIAAESGSPDKIKVLNDIELYTGDDGKPVLLGSVVDNTEALQNAEIVARRNNDSYIFQKRIEMSKLRSEEIPVYMEKLKKEDPEVWRILSPESDTVYRNAVTREQQEAVRKAKLAAKQAAQSKMGYILEAQFNAHMNNQATDGHYPVAQSISGLPKATYIDENGNTVTASYTPEIVYDFLRGKMMDLYTNPNISPQDKAKTAMRMLSWGPGEGYAKALKAQIQGAFDTANTNTMINDMDVGSVRSALEMYEADSGTFGRLFGSEITANVQTIRILRDLGKSTEDAIAIFTQGRDALKDPNLREQYAQAYKTQLESYPTATIMGMDGNYVDVPLTGDSLLNTHIRTMAMYLQGAGYSIQTAVQMAQQKASENYWAYNGHIFPKAWFSGLAVDDKGATAQTFLDHERYALADYAGTDVNNIFAIYNPYTDRIELKGNGVSAIYDRQTFTNQANKYAYDMYTQGQAMQQQQQEAPPQVESTPWDTASQFTLW